MKIEQNTVWRILVPVEMGHHSDPDLPAQCVEIPQEYHREWDQKVLAIIGGLTINKVSQGA